MPRSTTTSLPTAQAAATSVRPSPSKSPATRSRGAVGVATVPAAANPHAPVPRSSATDVPAPLLTSEVRDAVAAPVERGHAPRRARDGDGHRGRERAVADAAGTVAAQDRDARAAVVRHGEVGDAVAVESSAARIRAGLAPTAYAAGAPNVPSPMPSAPLPRRTSTALVELLVTARSTMPSRSKSAHATPRSDEPASVTAPPVNVPSPAPNQIATPSLTATARSGMPSPLKSLDADRAARGAAGV